MRWFFMSLMALLVSSLAGCASLNSSEQPYVTLSNIVPANVTLLEQFYDLQLRIQNPSPEPFSIKGMSFSLDINGKNFARGVSNSQVTIAGFATQLINTQVSSSLFGILRQIQSLSSGKEKVFKYRLSGRLYNDSALSQYFLTEDTIQLDF